MNNHIVFKAFIILLLTNTIISCKNTKKYYYQEGNKEEKIIEATSDSAAYLEAVKYFEISKKVFSDMEKSYGNIYIDKPISFRLFNNKREDITYQVHFLNKDSLEDETANNINKLPNTIEESVKRIREEKNGIGAKYDTAGLYVSPVKVLSARFVSKEYSNYKDIALKYKNIGTKKISAIRFKWYGENAFNEPADMGVLSNGWVGGFTEETLKPGSTGYGTWSILSKDGKKVLIAYAYEVAFEDGSKWLLSGN